MDVQNYSFGSLQGPQKMSHWPSIGSLLKLVLSRLGSSINQLEPKTWAIQIAESFRHERTEYCSQFDVYFPLRLNYPAPETISCHKKFKRFDKKNFEGTIELFYEIVHRVECIWSAIHFHYLQHWIFSPTE